ncbi:chymotrypsinogen B-like [Achroia grisella]|uniref:chymotrypsinogen B-like n=1 Tax=Achroia grisella TaxID=688607 RepID=UPI0027D1EC51|nr:chymotrypsinogen B-like [Achroia grisella]
MFLKSYVAVLLALTLIVASERDRRVITTLRFSRYYVKPTVVNGEPARPNEFPYLVSLKEPIQRITDSIKKWVSFCGGSIISESKVLTAAHCFESHNFYYLRNPKPIRAVAGNLHTDLIHSGETVTTKNTQWRRIAKIIIHRHFYFPTNDIALCFVDKIWVFNSNVDYIITARWRTDYDAKCVASGYGKTKSNVIDSISPVLLMAKISVLSQRACSKLWEINMDSFICTDSALTDVAEGDSGGPLVCRGTLDPTENGSNGLLVGVVSGKNFDLTTLFTRVSEYHDWIDRNLASCLRSDILCLIIIILVNYCSFF